MTDKEKLQEMIKYSECSFEDIILNFIRLHPKDFDAIRIHNIICGLNGVLLSNIYKLENAMSISEERATYLNKYLKGEMYVTEESAKEHIDIQITHTQAIIDACKRRDT